MHLKRSRATVQTFCTDIWPRNRRWDLKVPPIRTTCRLIATRWIESLCQSPREFPCLSAHLLRGAFLLISIWCRRDRRTRPSFSISPCCDLCGTLVSLHRAFVSGVWFMRALWRALGVTCWVVEAVLADNVSVVVWAISEAIEVSLGRLRVRFCKLGEIV